MIKTQQFLLVLFMLAVFTISLSPVMAQEERRHVLAYASYHISAPLNWQVGQRDEETDYLYTNTYNIDLLVFTLEEYAELSGNEYTDEEVIKSIFETLNDITVAQLTITSPSVDGIDYLSTDIVYEDISRTVLFSQLPNDTITYAEVFAIDGETEISDQIIREILTTALTATTGDQVRTMEYVSDFDITLTPGWYFDLEYEDGPTVFYTENHILSFDFYIPDDLPSVDFPTDDLAAAFRVLFVPYGETIPVDELTPEEVNVNGLDVVRVDVIDNFDDQALANVFVIFYNEQGILTHGYITNTTSETIVDDETFTEAISILNSITPVADTGASDQAYTVEPLDGFQFTLPGDWGVDVDEDIAYFYNDDHFLDFDFWLDTDIVENNFPADDLVSALEEVFYSVDEQTAFADVTVEISTTDGITFARTDHIDSASDETFPVTFIATYTADGHFIYGRIYPYEQADSIPEDIVITSLQIISSLQVINSD